MASRAAALSTSHTCIGDPIRAFCRRWRRGPGSPSAAFRASATPFSFPAAAAARKDAIRLVERAAELGLAESVAALYRDDPLEAEGAVRDMVFGVARLVLTDAFEALDDDGDALEGRGRTRAAR